MKESEKQAIYDFITPHLERMRNGVISRSALYALFGCLDEARKITEDILIDASDLPKDLRIAFLDSKITDFYDLPKTVDISVLEEITPKTKRHKGISVSSPSKLLTSLETAYKRLKAALNDKDVVVKSLADFLGSKGKVFDEKSIPKIIPLCFKGENPISIDIHEARKLVKLSDVLSPREVRDFNLLISNNLMMKVDERDVREAVAMIRERSADFASEEGFSREYTKPKITRSR
ncbi:MAG: hypothetical protein RLN62_03385 [Rickettsiales bacterium]